MRFFIRLISSFIVSLMMTSYSYALTYQEAVSMALQNAPKLQASQSVVTAQQSLQVSAGRLPDPKLLIGVENVPVSGNDAYSTTQDFMSMQKVGVMQDIPNSDKRNAEKKVAEADSQLATTQLKATRLTVQRDTTLAWLTLYYLQQKRNILVTQAKDNQLLVDSLSKAVNNGKNNVTELFQAKQESNDIADQRDLLELDITKARNQLAQFIGVVANNPLSGEPPHFTVDAKQLTQHLTTHPDLAQFDSLTNKADAELQSAMADKKSNWGVQLEYQKRGDEFGDMVSLEFNVGLPLFGSTRQNPRIAAKQAALTQVAFERETMYREHTTELNNDIQEYETIKRQLSRLQASRLPLAENAVNISMDRYRSGQDELNTVLMARRALYEIKLQKIDWSMQRDVIEARLHYLSGESS